MKEDWSLPENLHMVEYILNSIVNSETGFAPFQLLFGTDALPSFELPKSVLSTTTNKSSDFLRRLDNTLKELWALSREHQSKIFAQRQAAFALVKDTPHQYCTGDLVLMTRELGTRSKDAKLESLYLGPYEVLLQESNDLQVRHLASHIVYTYHVERFKPFFGSRSAAIELARTDLDHHLIAAILTYRGDPNIRTSLEFLVEFAAGVLIWKRWDLELFHTIPYEEFCRSRHELSLLLYPLKEAKAHASAIKKTAIATILPGQITYISLRFFGNDIWRSSLLLPNQDREYTHKCRYGQLRKNNTIELKVIITNEIYYFTNLDVHLWGRHHEPGTSIVLTTAHLRKHPALKPQKADSTTI